MSKKFITFLVVLSLGLVSLPAQAAWRVAGSAFTVYYCGPQARVERVQEVLLWHLDGVHIIWRTTLESSLASMIELNSANCGSDGRAEIRWTMDRTRGEGLIIPYLEELGIDTSGMTAVQLANSFSEQFKMALIKWETEYNEYQARLATPVADAVDGLEEP